METIVGFVAGYLAGCREGQAGLRRLRQEVYAIRISPEARRLVAEALMYAGAAVRQVAASRGASGLGGTIGSITDTLAQRASGDQAA
jgi:hypothetical protein